MILGTSEEIQARIGEYLKARRLKMNLTQKTLAERSAVSLNALKHLENGMGATLGTFVQVCRALGQDACLQMLEPSQETISPIAYAQALRKASPPRQRARSMKS